MRRAEVDTLRRDRRHRVGAWRRRCRSEADHAAVLGEEDPSTISATRVSPDTSAASRSARVSAAVTKQWETAGFRVGPGPAGDLGADRLEEWGQSSRGGWRAYYRMVDRVGARPAWRSCRTEPAIDDNAATRGIRYRYARLRGLPASHGALTSAAGTPLTGAGPEPALGSKALSLSAPTPYVPFCAPVPPSPAVVLACRSVALC